MAQRRRRLPTVSPVTLAGRCRSREGSLVPSPRSGYRDQREKKKTTEPNPRSQHPAAPEPNPHGNCKNPHPTLPVWAACFGRGGKKKEEKIKRIEKSHLQVYLPEETRHLGKSGVGEGRARCKGPSDTQSTCEIPLPCPSTRFNPIFPGILALGEGASTVASAAKPTLTAYTQNQAVFLFASKAAHFPQALRHEPLGAPRDDTSPGGGSEQWTRILGLDQCPYHSFPHHPGNNSQKKTQNRGQCVAARAKQSRGSG